MDEATVYDIHISSGLEAKSSRRKWAQIILAVSLCYICICGGNLVGYTSSAIPSIRKGKSDPFFLLSGREEFNLSNYSNDDKSTVIGFRVQDLDLSSHSEAEGVRIYKDVLPQRSVGYEEFINLTDEQASWIGGLAPLGAFFGSILATIPIKYLGPKGTVLRVGGPAFLISWLITAFAPSVAFIYLGRMIGGLALGMTISAVPLYIVETASIELRGPLGTLPQFVFTLGVLITFICGSVLDWRMSALTCAAMVLPVFVIVPFAPESPIWLISRNRMEEAESAYRLIHGFTAGTREFKIAKEQFCLDVNQNAEVKKWNKRSFSFLLSPPALRSSFVAIFLCVFQQLTGINGVNFYTVTIFETAAGPHSFLNEHTSSIVVAIVFCFANLCSYVLIEKLGRKVLLLISTLLISIAAFALGGYFYILEVGKDTKALHFIPLASLVTFVLAFSIGYGPLLYVVVAEILPNEIRGVMNPIAVGINWLCVFIVAKTFPGLVNVLGAYGAFWLYGSFTLVSLVFTAAYLPETKGKTESEIQRFFGKYDLTKSVSFSEKEEQIGIRLL